VRCDAHILPETYAFRYCIQPEYVWAADCLGPSVDPDKYFVFANKLYLFLKEDPRGKFIGQAAYNVYRGDQRWKYWFPTGQAPMNTKCIM
jgi:hypothetical protein